MEFELKKVESTGAVQDAPDNKSIQHLNIVVGVVDCPHNDICALKTIVYEFSNELSLSSVKQGMQEFAENWVSENYPNI